MLKIFRLQRAPPQYNKFHWGKNLNQEDYKLSLQVIINLKINDLIIISYKIERKNG